MNTFGARLTEMIEDKKVKQIEVARACDMPASQISKYCKGANVPTGKALMKLCEALDCAPDWLLKGEGSKEDKFKSEDFSPLLNMDNRVRLKRKSGEFLLVVKLTIAEIRDMFGTVISVM